ncbi:hypothetical protein [Stenotrophomonas maltophilia]|uniref:hypothetical protein n=1 Tax=Stenotrophomonas maltophilia TaxID=40324 RepID=UPI00209B1D74|nr:hypothetical protein [Stenotrophomonas maltophilia]MCO7473070.1 hypothetical protein [Stenotrophomonas maltophilia]
MDYEKAVFIRKVFYKYGFLVQFEGDVTSAMTKAVNQQGGSTAVTWAAFKREVLGSGITELSIWRPSTVPDGRTHLANLTDETAFDFIDWLLVEAEVRGDNKAERRTGKRLQVAAATVKQQEAAVNKETHKLEKRAEQMRSHEQETYDSAMRKSIQDFLDTNDAMEAPEREWLEALVKGDAKQLTSLTIIERMTGRMAWLRRGGLQRGA